MSPFSTQRSSLRKTKSFLSSYMVVKSLWTSELGGARGGCRNTGAHSLNHSSLNLERGDLLKR